jgi:hypothetical protein
MQWSAHLRRLVIALLVSIAVNIILFAIDFSINPLQPELSRTQQFVVRLLGPADALTTRLAPRHGGAQIAALVMFSVVVYCIVAWVFISLPLWWRNRA